MAFGPKMIGVTVSVTAKAKETLERQAQARGLSPSMWAGQLFDAGFAAACAREKSMPLTDADLDAIVAMTLMVWADGWHTAKIARALGVSEPLVVRMLDAWRDYRRGQDGVFISQPERSRP